MHSEPCDCEDFEPDTDADDSGYVCVCGHVDEEHAPSGFFRPCEVGRG